MPKRGGARPGAGRPKGTGGRKCRLPIPGEDRVVPPDVARAAINAGLTPLEYMLAVMRDEGADQVRRDRMAMAAAPYCHPRMVEDQRVGKKEVRKEKAKAANTAWLADIALRRDRGEGARA